MFERNCPECKKSIIYRNKRKYNDACKKKTLCRSCSKIGSNNHMYGKFGSLNPNYGQKRYNISGDKNPSKREDVRKKISERKKMSVEKFIEISRSIHTIEYDYSLVKYENNRSYLEIICPIHGLFIQQAQNHINGYGCNKCKTKSKGESKIELFLIKNGIKYVKEKYFDDCRGKKRPLPFDFYLIEYSLCIEYDGRQHFESVSDFGGDIQYIETIKNDKIKNEYCDSNNIKLVRIKYTDDIEKELNSLVKKL